MEELGQKLAALTDIGQRLQILTSFNLSLAVPKEQAAVPLLAGEAYFLIFTTRLFNP